MIDALEAYSATHPESVEELMDWPWQRFEAFYEAFMRRRAVEDLERRKTAIVTGLYGNGNIGGDDLKKSIEGIEENFNTAVEVIYGREEDDEIDKDNPFFGKIRLPDMDQPSVDPNNPFEVETDSE